jgi:hypothetical protein
VEPTQNQAPKTCWDDYGDCILPLLAVVAAIVAVMLLAVIIIVIVVIAKRRKSRAASIDPGPSHHDDSLSDSFATQECESMYVRVTEK